VGEATTVAIFDIPKNQAPEHNQPRIAPEIVITVTSDFELLKGMLAMLSSLARQLSVLGSRRIEPYHPGPRVLSSGSKRWR
jgi:hypothetical protein